MADLPSILGGMAQGFLDFGKSAVDLFGTGGAAVGDLVDTIRTGKVSTKNQDDFRKWLYNTNDVQDAAAKGLGTALNGVQTVTDYIPGIGSVTKNPLFNAGQGALGGLADEFKTYGKDYDLGRAGERAAVSAGAALASGGLGDALKKSANPLLSSSTVQGLARGATGGAITGGGYAAIDGGDVMQSALQGAGTGALIGGATGAIQDFMPRKATYDMALTDDERQARIANAKNMLANEQNPERIAELNNQIKDLGGTLADADMAVNSPRLTPEQEAFFKDSVIRDENGNLKPMYHGSPDGTFTVFKDGSFFTDDKDYADVYQDNYAGITGGKKTINPKTYETYLNIKKPFTMADPEARRIIENEYVGRDKNYWVTDPSDATEVDFTEADNLRNWLKKNHPEYDGMYVSEGGGDMFDPDFEEERGVSVVPFSPNQIKDINNLAPTDAPDIMASRMTPEDVNLGRALANQDLSVNGGLSIYTDSMAPETRRALDIIMQRDVPVENELYNRIDPKTLPQGYEKLRNLVDSRTSIDEQVQKKLGKNPLKADVDELLDYLYPNEPLEKRVFHKSLNESIEKYKKDAAALGVDASKAAEDMTRTKKLELIKKIYDDVKFDTIADIGKGIDVGDDLLYATQAYDRRGIRTGYPGALDTALSERLDIAPGNTIKITDSQYDWIDDDFKRKNLGRYTRNAKDISVREGISGIEGDISTMAHERLHSFQNEARPENAGRYSKEVSDAYNELSKDLKPYIKDDDSIAKIYGASDANYYASPIEQESRMLQTYLDNKGYTKDALYWRNKQNGGNPEWGNEINPAFDKFFDKLRDLSKRGVALPALAALFGGGAYMASQNNDKEKEVK